MVQKIENQGDYNININGVKGDVNINSQFKFYKLEKSTNYIRHSNIFHWRMFGMANLTLC